MSQPLITAKQLDWAGWRLGIIRSLIQGGSHAVLGSTILSLYDPKDFGVNNAVHTIVFTVALFLGGGFMRLMFFLNDHPVADVQTVTTTVTDRHTEETTVTQAPAAPAAPVPVPPVPDAH